jgi:hypothetical protein
MSETVLNRTHVHAHFFLEWPILWPRRILNIPPGTHCTYLYIYIYIFYNKYQKANYFLQSIVQNVSKLQDRTHKRNRKTTYKDRLKRSTLKEFAKSKHRILLDQPWGITKCTSLHTLRKDFKSQHKIRRVTTNIRRDRPHVPQHSNGSYTKNTHYMYTYMYLTHIPTSTLHLN